MSDTHMADHETSHHPSTTTQLFGHESAQEAFLTALGTERLPHAWLISGPSGVGKATLAYAIARFMLSSPRGELASNARQALDGNKGLQVATDAAVNARIVAGSHGDLLVVERGFDEKRQRERTEIPVDQIRRILPFMQSTAAEGGWRVAIVDGADTMNRSAQNALLKGLEEPPNHTLLLLLADRPERLLPTVKSRCRQMSLQPLDEEALSAALSSILGSSAAELASIIPLAGGCPGEGMRIAQADIHGLWGDMQAVMGLNGAMEGKASRRQSLATSVANDPVRWLYFGRLLQHWLHDQAKGTQPGAAQPHAGMLDQPFTLWDKVSRQMAEADQRNLDRRLVALQILEQIRHAA